MTPAVAEPSSWEIRSFVPRFQQSLRESSPSTMPMTAKLISLVKMARGNFQLGHRMPFLGGRNSPPTVIVSYDPFPSRIAATVLG